MDRLAKWLHEGPPTNRRSKSVGIVVYVFPELLRMFLGPSESPTIGEGRAEFAAKLPFEGGRVRSGEVQDQGVRLALAGPQPRVNAQAALARKQRQPADGPALILSAQARRSHFRRPE
jgi:hypothetical protein